MGTAKEQFAERLRDAMLDAGHKSTRNAKSGVDVGPIAKAAKVTREMARRYTEGTAIPDVNKMQRIAESLGVRLAWLRDGEGDKRHAGAHLEVHEPGAEYPTLSEEAIQVAVAWSKLAPTTRATVRDVIFMLALGERRFPWLRRGRPEGETYDEWERRQEQNFGALSQLAADRKTRVKS